MKMSRRKTERRMNDGTYNIKLVSNRSYHRSFNRGMAWFHRLLKNDTKSLKADMKDLRTEFKEFRNESKSEFKS